MRPALSRLALPLALLALAPAIGAPDARADEATTARAEALFKTGRAALEKGDFTTACAQFAESLKLNARPSVSFNLAGCEEHEGRIIASLRHWQEGLAAIDARDERAPVARERIAALEKRLPHLTVRLPADAPAAAAVKVDGVDVKAGVALPMDPGEHVVVLTSPGQAASRTTVRLADGEQREETLAPAPPSVAGPPAPAPAAADAGRHTRRTAGYALLGVGVAGALGAGVTGGVLLSRNATIQSECPSKRCDAAGLSEIGGSKTLIAVNAVTWVLAIAGLGAGIPLVLTSRDAAAPAQGTVGLGVSPSPRGAILGASGTF